MPRILRIAAPVLALAGLVCADSNPLEDARKELYAARYDHAVELYRKTLTLDPAQPEAYYGLVRALLRSHHSAEAYEAADQGLSKAPQTAGVETAAGMAIYRRGDLIKAQDYFAAALKIDANYPGALEGLAVINNAASQFAKGRRLSLEAYKNSPDDPALMSIHANTLKGAEHLAALAELLAIYDPQSREARAVRAHIASDKALGDKKVRRLTSPYEASQMKLVRLWKGPTRARGVGLRVEFNGKAATLLVDTGASGISITPKFAEKAGLGLLMEESTEMNGIGDGRTQDSFHYLAGEVRAGTVTFADYPVSAFRAAKDSDFDGIIGADVFDRFLVSLDMPGLVMDLEPRRGAAPANEDAPPPAAGFAQAMRFGDHLALFANINGHPARLFLIDTGSTQTIIDTAIAREEAHVTGDAPVTMHGIQGKVKQTSVAREITLTFAGFRENLTAMLAFNMDSLSDSAGFGLAGILGMPELSRMRLTIDYRNGLVRMERKQ